MHLVTVQNMIISDKSSVIFLQLLYKGHLDRYTILIDKKALLHQIQIT
jgi:hypothetical protein